MAHFDLDSRKLTYGNLLLVADPISKTVLTAYDYRPTVKRAANVAKLISSKFTLEILEQCATFLNIPTKDDKSETALYSNKQPMATRIVLGIEALYPSHCVTCDTDYTTEFDSKEDTLCCYKCFQESHTCEEMKKRTLVLKGITDLPAGVIWLCNECTVELNPTSPPKKKRTITGTGTPGQGGTPVISIPGTPTNGTARGSEKGHNINKDELAKALQMAKEEISQLEKDENNQDAKQSYNSVTSTKLCPQFLAHNCQHGRKGDYEVGGKVCEFVHPKLCRRYCADGSNRKYGCTRGRQCFYYHPKLCWNSTETRHCPEENCTFSHLRGTRRGPLETSDRELDQGNNRPRRSRSEYRRNDPGAIQQRSERRLASRSNQRQEVYQDRTTSDRERRREDPDPSAKRTTTTTATTTPSTQATGADAENNNLTVNNNNFLQLMGLVTSMQEEFKRVTSAQEEFRKDMVNMRLNLNNVSLASLQPSEQINMSSQYVPAPVPLMNTVNYPYLPSFPRPYN